MLLKFLFPTNYRTSGASVFLLALRVFFGGLLMVHGVQKVMNFEDLSSTFADPFNIGAQNSLMLAIFGEVICPLGFIFGFLYRLSVLPMIATMWVAYFIIHADSNFASKELSLVYLVVFALMFFIGAGKYSFDYAIGEKYNKRHSYYY